jgi:hypothetical protein
MKDICTIQVRVDGVFAELAVSRAIIVALPFACG